MVREPWGFQARIQDSEGGGGGSYIQKGGGGFVQEFQERIQIVAGPWANQQAKKTLQTAVGGGGPSTPPPKKKTLYPRLGSHDCGPPLGAARALLDSFLTSILGL